GRRAARWGRGWRAPASGPCRLALIGRPCPSRVYQLPPPPASGATSSRRSPGVRRRGPGGSPTSSGCSPARGALRKSPSSARRDRSAWDGLSLPLAIWVVVTHRSSQMVLTKRLSASRQGCTTALLGMILFGGAALVSLFCGLSDGGGGAGWPELVPAAAGVLAAQRDDVGGAFDGPVHA